MEGVSNLQAEAQKLAGGWKAAPYADKHWN